MKAISLSLIVIAMLSIMAMGLVVAEGNQTGVDDSTGTPNLIETQNSGDLTQIQNRIMDGTYMNQDGEQIQLRTGEGNQVRIQAGTFEAVTNMIMTQEMAQNKTRLHVELSNGNKAEVMIMPNTAAKKAGEGLGLNCEGNCTMELKEVQKKGEPRAAYEVKTQKQAKVFGLFQAQMQVQAQVDAETGEVIQTKKPWWAFLATE